MAGRAAPRFAVTVSDRTIGDIGPPLLAYLRRELDAPSLEYAEPPAPMLGGFDTLIFAFRIEGVTRPYSLPLVVRIFRSAEDARRAEFETTIQRAIVALGYPAPNVLMCAAGENDVGWPFMIMERIPGRVMLDALIGHGFFRMARILGQVQARLHGLDAAAFRRQIGAARDPRRLDSIDDIFGLYRASIDRASLDGLRDGMRWLDEHRPPAPGRESICHGDFHPLNVLVDGGELSGVVDWGWACVADPAYDVGATCALLTQGPVDLPAFLQPVVRRVRGLLVRRYLRAYVNIRPVDLDAAHYYEAFRLLGFLCEAGEQIQVAAGVIPATDMLTAFNDPRVRRGIIDRFRQITGVQLALPAPEGG